MLKYLFFIVEQKIVNIYFVLVFQIIKFGKLVNIILGDFLRLKVLDNELKLAMNHVHIRGRSIRSCFGYRQ